MFSFFFGNGINHSTISITCNVASTCHHVIHISSRPKHSFACCTHRHAHASHAFMHRFNIKCFGKLRIHGGHATPQDQQPSGSPLDITTLCMWALNYVCTKGKIPTSSRRRAPSMYRHIQVHLPHRTPDTYDEESKKKPKRNSGESLNLFRWLAVDPTSRLMPLKHNIGIGTHTNTNAFTFRHACTSASPLTPLTPHRHIHHNQFWLLLFNSRNSFGPTYELDEEVIRFIWL